MPPVKLDELVDDGDMIRVGKLRARSLAHAGPHRQPAFVPPGQSAVQRRQHLSRRLRRRDRRPSRQRHSGVHQVAQAHPRQRRRMAAAQPRPDLPQGQRLARRGHRPAGRLSAHGRFRHLRRRLAADGRVGQGAGRRQDAASRPRGRLAMVAADAGTQHELAAVLCARARRLPPRFKLCRF